MALTLGRSNAGVVREWAPANCAVSISSAPPVGAMHQLPSCLWRAVSTPRKKRLCKGSMLLNNVNVFGAYNVETRVQRLPPKAE